MSQTLIACARRKEATVASKLAVTQHNVAKQRWAHAQTAEDKRRAEEQLKKRAFDVQVTMKELKEADKRVRQAAMKEQEAQRSRADMERQVNQTRWNLTKSFTSAQIEIGRARALRIKEAAISQRPEPKPEPEPEPEPEPTVVVEPVVVATEDDGIDSMPIEELVPTLRDSIGPQEEWKVKMCDKDVAIAERVCERLTVLLACKTTKEEKKQRKAAIEAGIFDQIGFCMRKYAPPLRVRGAHPRPLRARSLWPLMRTERRAVARPARRTHCACMRSIGGVVCCGTGTRNIPSCLPRP